MIFSQADLILKLPCLPFPFPALQKEPPRGLLCTIEDLSIDGKGGAVPHHSHLTTGQEEQSRKKPYVRQAWKACCERVGGLGPSNSLRLFLLA